MPRALPSRNSGGSCRANDSRHNVNHLDETESPPDEAGLPPSFCARGTHERVFHAGPYVPFYLLKDLSFLKQNKKRVPRDTPYSTCQNTVSQLSLSGNSRREFARTTPTAVWL